MSHPINGEPLDGPASFCRLIPVGDAAWGAPIGQMLLSIKQALAKMEVASVDLKLAKLAQTNLEYGVYGVLICERTDAVLLKFATKTSMLWMFIVLRPLEGRRG